MSKIFKIEDRRQELEDRIKEDRSKETGDRS